MIGLYHGITIDAIEPGKSKLRHKVNFGTYRTVAFDEDFMREFIRISSMNINLDIWWDFVPEVYREDVRLGIDELSPRYVGRRLTEKLVFYFISDLRDWIGENVEPR